MKDEDGLGLLRIEEIRRTLPSMRFGVKQMKRTLVMSGCYTVAVLCNATGKSEYQTPFLFFALLTIVLTVIEEYDKYSRAKMAAILELLQFENRKLTEK